MSEDRKKGVSRRDTLKGMAVAAGAAAMPPLLQACGADEPEPVDLKSPLRPEEVPIDTVVFVMMENRSFDHYFGALGLEEGRTDVDGLTSELYNEDEHGTKVFPKLAARMCVEDPPHGYGAGVTQFADGTNAGFVKAHMESGHGGEAVLPNTVMDYHNRKQLPFIYNLADDFVLCDRWFSSFRGPTWPNRWYAHGAQSMGERGNPLDKAGAFNFDMIYDRLAEKGLTFKYYYTDLPFLILSNAFMEKYGDHIAPIHAFHDDAEHGRLPNYCFVDPGYALNDDHPPHHVGLGQQFMSTVYHSLAQSPQWERSIIFYSYDECGGFYDHVPPPAVEDDSEDEAFQGLGFRVPGLVAGPWVKNEVSHTQYEHTSVLAFTQWKWGLEPLTKRDANANNFVDVLDVKRIREKNPRKAPLYDPVEVDDSEITSACQYGGGSLGLSPVDVQIVADMGLIPQSLDRRPYRLQTLRAIKNLELSRKK